MKSLSFHCAGISRFLLPAIIATPWMATPVRADLLVSNFGGFVLRYPDSAVNQQYNFTTFPNTIIFPGPQSGGLSRAAGITMGPDGNIYVSSYSTGEILQFDPHGAYQSVFATLPLDYNPATMMFDLTAAPAHVQFHDTGLYVSDNNGSNVYRFEVTKNPLSGALSAAAIPTPAVTGLVGAGAFTFTSNGDLYASSFAGPSMFDPPGSPPFLPAVVKVHNGVQAPFAYPVTDNMGNTVAPVSPANPNGLLFVNNHLLVVDLFGNNILKYDANGQYQGVFATIPPPAGVDPPPTQNFPSDMVLSRDGQSIFVAVLGYTQDPMTPPAGAVLKYDLNGNLLATVASGLPIASSIALGVQKGDLNLDGVVDAADIKVIMQALTNVSDYQSSHHLNDDELTIVADVNGDRRITNADLQSLLEVLKNSGPHMVPEPSSIVLASLALSAIMLGFHRRLALR